MRSLAGFATDMVAWIRFSSCVGRQGGSVRHTRVPHPGAYSNAHLDTVPVMLIQRIHVRPLKPVASYRWKGNGRRRLTNGSGPPGVPPVGIASTSRRRVARGATVGIASTIRSSAISKDTQKVGKGSRENPHAQIASPQPGGGRIKWELS
jgi:hypothetical protein